MPLLLMPCLHLSFYQGKQLLRSNYLSLVHSFSVYTGSSNSSWSFNIRARCINNVMKSNLHEDPTALEQEQIEVPSFS